MRHFFSILLSPLLAGITLLTPFSAGAKEFLPNNLMENSPFVWQDFNPDVQGSSTSSRKSSQAVELRGLYSLNRVYRFNIFDTQAKKGTWIKKGEKKNGLEVINFNASTETLTINVNGKRMSLTLKKPSNNPSPQRKLKTLPNLPNKRESIRKRRDIRRRVSRRRPTNVPSNIPAPPPGALTGTAPNIPPPPNMGKIGSNGLPEGIPDLPAEALEEIAKNKSSSTNTTTSTTSATSTDTTSESNSSFSFPEGLQAPPDLPSELRDL